MKGKLKYFLTGTIVLIAVFVVAIKYWDYVTNPWTRDGQVRANVVQVATRVSGPIVKLPIEDNQFVKTGELLFEIDPRPFAIAVDASPRLLSSTPPRKLDVTGTAQIAAYVDTKGNCLGGVPLDLPFPGMTSSVSQSLTGSRFEPAHRHSGRKPASWRPYP